jgi:hypothetical protein
MLERMAQGEMLQLFRKTGADLTPKEGQSTEPTAVSQANQNLLQAESQTDLTSTDSSVQINTANAEEMPVEPTQKKT